MREFFFFFGVVVIEREDGKINNFLVYVPIHYYASVQRCQYCFFILLETFYSKLV